MLVRWVQRGEYGRGESVDSPYPLDVINRALKDIITASELTTSNDFQGFEQRTGLVFPDDPRFGAIGNRTADDTSAINAAIAYAISTKRRAVRFKPGNGYRTTGPLNCHEAVSLSGYGFPAGGVGNGNYGPTSIIHDHSGPCILFDGAVGALEGSGGGVSNLRLVNMNGSSVTADGVGSAVKITGIDANHRASWVQLQNLLIENSVGSDSWSYAVEVDGTPITGSGISDVRIHNVSAHTECANKGAVRLAGALGTILADCDFYSATSHADVFVTGLSGTPSLSVRLMSCSGGQLKLDWATDTTMMGGIWTSIIDTVNVAGNTLLMPGRLVNAFTPVGTNAVVVDHFRRGAAVANATGAGDVVTQLNALLTRLRASGVITT